MITLRSLQALFIRYSSIHRQYGFRPRAIRAAGGKGIGWLESQEIRGNHRCVSGWVEADEVGLICGEGHRLAVEPVQFRADVQAAYGGTGKVGFSLTLPYIAGTGRLVIRKGTETVEIALRDPAALRRGVETLRLAAAFAWAGIQGLPAALIYLRSTDRARKDRAKARLKALFLGRTDMVQPLRIGAGQLGLAEDSPLLSRAGTAERGAAAQRITIILPVYNAFDLLQLCLSRLVAHTDLDWHLVLIEDGSPDPQIRPFLRKWCESRPAGQVSLLENARNLGFIGSVNRGFAEALRRDAPVVLLNSDALVPEGWASRLVAPLADPRVASVTPMSNDAEIMNAPVICQRGDLPDGVAEGLDACARMYFAQAPLAELPTGVGFCMGIGLDWLRRFPEFDPVFGRGYGEEVDWCRKTQAEGARHLGVPGLFVEHRGGTSFGSEEKRRLIEENGRRITARYPHFDADVQGFIARDPMIGPRLGLGLAWAGAMQQAPLSVFVVHSLGGGAEDAMRRDISRLCAEGQSAVVLQLGGATPYRMTLMTPLGETVANLESDAVLAHLLAAVPRRRIVYICGVGDARPETLPDRLLAWRGAAEGSELVVEFHDFFPLSPSYTLLGDTGRFEGVPRPETHGGQACHQVRDAQGREIGLQAWQDLWHRALTQARIVVFSENSREIVQGCWPDLAPQIRLRPHDVLEDVPSVARVPLEAPRTIGILGNIGYQKGAEILQIMARQLGKSGAARLVLLGNIDPNYPLGRACTIHGSYARQDIALLAERYKIDCWLIPSIWPETFSFTTRETLATGLPVWCFDLGAQADALRAAGQEAHLLPLPQNDEDVAQVLRRICQS
ncbi:glycosyltransferase [Thioclava sp. GXIMD4215]|uniref:glycosyltransferase n=1 Tax=Thioclava sp. GXIMD4215 TaxID=3131928 RepID=UPI00311B1371